MKYQVSWHTVDEAAGSAWSTERKRYPRRESKVDQYAAIIDAILLADLDAPRKQRHTVRRIHARLIDERSMADVSYGRLRAYVAERKPQIAVASVSARNRQR
ncbi:hypothetical protein BOX37_12785 [Nocardia mangyaensis]|uniref:Transposase n=1 Tax=Nocardia mangyaensis TaxID=2213200 RepID=A0A1J0VRM9_9NOCA|nr:hypothetical protein [Nocardia mangyaensis]APE34685.1 hypothetical protein BOX37_12785 [Nocardia mangyaensis]